MKKLSVFLVLVTLVISSVFAAETYISDGTTLTINGYQITKVQLRAMRDKLVQQRDTKLAERIEAIAMIEELKNRRDTLVVEIQAVNEEITLLNARIAACI